MKVRTANHVGIWIAIAGGSIALSGCGGGGSDKGARATPAVLSGVFVDAPVEGLEYSSGNTSGITDASGTFRYEDGQPVIFKLGSVTIGQIATGKARVYPIDLVSGAIDESDPTVSNILRVLQTLDDDGVPDNGILITAAVRNSLTTTINFSQSKAAFSADPNVAAAMAAATAKRTSGPTGLKDSASAEAHFRSTLLADFAGVWSARYTGTSGPPDNGTCSFTVNAIGNGTGTCFSSPYNQTIAVAGNISSSGNALITGVTNTGAAFSGTFTRTATASGNWTNAQVGSAGTWTATKN